MRRLVSILIITGAAAVVGLACATTVTPTTPHFKVRISAFADPAAASKTSFVLYPGVEGVNTADLEYREYARYIRKALAAKGLIEANDPKSAELVIFVNYGIGEPETTNYSGMIRRGVRIPHPRFGKRCWI